MESFAAEVDDELVKFSYTADTLELWGKNASSPFRFNLSLYSY